MQDITQLFKALSDETRLRILSLMKEGEICVCDIADTLNMTQPNISFHLGMLKEAGLIKDRKNGRWVHYSLNGSDMFTRFLLFGIFEKIKDIPSEKIKRSRKC
ncbi:MAG TPA: metalloregulator ArsR/SmtB family transcription factor [Nitrospirae bacterium]|nr:HTH-type transcriptional repressor AseR [bacterium BMS3Abin06]HDH11642.1 metalloregulator ArsR/SmtB family transcription factor [Nitrospirota bacterium]HDZ02062.1 metalloregulator ArsR/SmtB family transcription factor [Nitrospirota bacterium]